METNEETSELAKQIKDDCYNEEFDTLPIERIVGVRNEERSNFLMVTPRKSVHFSGMYFAVSDFLEQSQNTFFSRDGGGIGAIALHHSKEFLAVGEKGQRPSIFVYQLSDMSVVSVLSGGTERGFCSVSFSKNSDKFVSVGGSPDYSIVVWDWRTGQILLRAKAFSQEVYRVAFSDFSDDVLCSAGMAHIKFWRIAKTFTGLKLKGEIGKFGSTELSDIQDFVHLGDGNVVSGSESGHLLIWEGNFIKNVVRQSEREPCHSGNINCLKSYKERLLLSGSASDNILKVWPVFSFRNINGEGGLELLISPVKQVALEEGCGIVSIDISHLDKGLVFVQEKHGGLYEVRLSDCPEDIDCKAVLEFTPVVKRVFGFSCDRISGIALDQKTLLVGGNDGYFKEIDVAIGNVWYWEADAHPVTALCLSSSGKTVLLGNQKGLVKSYQLPVVKIVSVLKVFEESVQFIRVEDPGVVCASKANVFVLGLNASGELSPRFLVETGCFDITCCFVFERFFVFGNAGEKSAASACPPEQQVCQGNYLCDHFDEEFSARLRMMEFQKPKKDEDDIRYYLNDEIEFKDVEWEPQAIRALSVYYDELSSKVNPQRMKVLVSSEGNFTGQLYLLELAPTQATAQEVGSDKGRSPSLVRPLRAFPTRAKVVSFINYELDKNYCFWGYTDGVVSVRDKTSLDQEIARVRAHSHDFGEVVMVSSFKTDRVYSFAKDSTVAVLGTTVQRQSALDRSSAKGRLSVLPRFDCQGQSRGPDEEAVCSGYSLQKDKIQSLKDKLTLMAKSKREEIIRRVAKLRLSFACLKEDNRRLSPEMRIPEADLDFDSAYSRELLELFEADMEETQKEVEYDVKVARMRVEKLSRFFLKENTELVFAVSKLSSPSSVESFRLKRMTNFMVTGLEQISVLIENEKGLENEEAAEGGEPSGSSNAKALLATLADLKRRLNDSKTRDPYLQFKQRVKEECVAFDTIDKLREQQKKVAVEVEKTRKSDQRQKTIEESADVQKAKGNFGDFMLKTSPNFRIDEHNRVDLHKLETHILLLEKFVANTKDSFNRSLGELRSRKQAIIAKVREVNDEVSAINRTVGVSEAALEVVFEDKKEFPELKLRVAEEEIERFLAEQGHSGARSGHSDSLTTDLDVELWTLRRNTLLSFPDISCKLEKQVQAIQKLGFRGSDSHRKEHSTADETGRLNPKTAFLAEVRRKQEAAVPATLLASLSDLKRLSLEHRPKKRTNPDNPKLQQVKALEHLKLETRKRHLLERVRKDIELFDREIDKVIVEKRKTEGELKMAQMRVLELYREWLEIQIFEEEDQVMRRELGERKQQINEWNEKRIANVFAGKDLLVKTTKLEADLKSLEETFKEKVFPAEPEKAEFVYRYFSANYRRSQAGDVGDDSDEGALKEFDPSNLDSEKKECVLYFEQNEDWVELLKKRYDVDEGLRAMMRTKGTLDSDNHRIDDRIKSLQKGLLETKSDLDELQMKKLQRINRLNCSFILDADQVFLSCPLKDLDSAVVFTKSQFNGLRSRTSELEEECAKIEAERSELYVSQDALVRSLNVLRTCKKQAKEELDENFKLKFGEYVDLEILNSLKETKKLKEMKKEYREVDKASAKRVEDARCSLSKTQEELVELKHKNTEILKRITLLGNAQIRLNKTLDNTNKQIFKDEKDLESENTQTNKKDLLGIIKLLNNELDALKNEISMLKHK